MCLHSVQRKRFGLSGPEILKSKLGWVMWIYQPPTDRLNPAKEKKTIHRHIWAQRERKEREKRERREERERERKRERPLFPLSSIAVRVCVRECCQREIYTRVFLRRKQERFADEKTFFFRGKTFRWMFPYLVSVLVCFCRPLILAPHIRKSTVHIGAREKLMLGKPRLSWRNFSFAWLVNFFA